MSKHYAEKDITESKFLFASYSHQNAAVVHNAIDFLLEQGIQVWFDKALHNGDDWDVVAKEKIDHENCVGVIFFNSPQSYISDPVSKERQFTIDKCKKSEESGKKFHIFVLNIEKTSTLRILREVFMMLPDNDAEISKVLKTKQVSIILEMFPDTRIYSYLTNENTENVMKSLCDDIIKKAPETYNKSNLVLNKILNNDDTKKVLFIDFGIYEGEKIRWSLVKKDEENFFFLASDIIETNYGDDLENLLNNKLLKEITDEKEKIYPGEYLRLLTVEESKQLGESVLKVGCEWWLADKRGSLQSTVRDDGTVYQNGYNNKRFRKGVRPLLVLTAEHVGKISSI